MEIHTQQGLITETVVYRTQGDTETGNEEEKKMRRRQTVPCVIVSTNLDVSNRGYTLFK